MKKYTDIYDIEEYSKIIIEAISLKNDPFQFEKLGKHKTLVMLFFNASLRTRLSTEKAAKNLGMQVMVLNVNEAWQLEFQDGAVMNLDKAEHIKEAAQVISVYADIIAVRAFPTLTDKSLDQSEYILNSFVKYANVPILNMESAIAHPLQALADAITITELKNKDKPKVVLSWAPHPKALPHAVANSFVAMMQNLDVELSIACPKGYELDTATTKETPVYNDQNETLKNADFVYVKNWSSFSDYGKVLHNDTNWMMTPEKLGRAKFMHCLPVRRNVVVVDAVLDGPNSLVIQQANNRTFAAQIVLKKIVENL
ncbi:MAG: acetylornithine carbamoyltransferase [Winogradskyella sp.]|nr:acetylornithine carbamoyltransferase [Winogradskyella sp.]